MIQNIWAIGRNYADHAKELGNAIPTEPLIFLKAGSTATLAAKEIILPSWVNELDHEIELALQFDENLQIDEACVALDLTDRAKQLELKSKGQPWTLAKSFKGSCPLSSFFPVADLEELKGLELILKVQGEIRQHGFVRDMIFPLEKIIDYVRQHFPVMPGDLLLTGTPAGVKPFQKGQTIEAEIKGKVRHSWVVK